MAKVVEKHRERKGTWLVRVCDDAETRSIFIPFKTEPADRQAINAFDAIIAAELEAKAAEVAEKESEKNSRVTLREAIVMYEEGRMTNAQAKKLLDAMIARARKLDLI